MWYACTQLSCHTEIIPHSLFLTSTDLVHTYSVVPQGGAVALMMLRSDIKLGAIVGELITWASWAHCAEGCRRSQTGHGSGGDMFLVCITPGAAVPTGSRVAAQPPACRYHTWADPCEHVRSCRTRFGGIDVAYGGYTKPPCCTRARLLAPPVANTPLAWSAVPCTCAAAGLSCYVPLSKEQPVISEANKDTPIFMCHGDADQTV